VQYFFLVSIKKRGSHLIVVR